MRKLFLLLPLLAFLVVAPLPVQAISDARSLPFPAPEISTTGEWLNSTPLTSNDLKGKVVLVDFWTYSCINCLRTLPYIKSWYEQYKDKGFVIIGVHAPEFDFEKSKANVEKAIRRFEITYLVVQDNDHILWNRFQNQYWPAHYLINKQGQVVYTHFGEGNYDVTEKTIRALLDEKGDMAKSPHKPDGYTSNQTHETYLGTARQARLEPNEPLPVDHWFLSTGWKRDTEYSESLVAGASLKIHFRGGKVFLVLGTADGQPTKAKILYNGKPAIDVGGKDVTNGIVEITDHRLYELIDLKKNGQGQLEIQSTVAGLRAFAFTFGGF